MAVKFKPYYYVAAYSKSRNKIMSNHLMTEMEPNKRLMSLAVAKPRAREYAASLKENKHLGAVDWEPKVYVVSELGKYLVD